MAVAVLIIQLQEENLEDGSMDIEVTLRVEFLDIDSAIDGTNNDL